jgi:hypothetical protein
MRDVICGSRPVAGRPRCLFGVTFIDFFIILGVTENQAEGKFAPSERIEHAIADDLAFLAAHPLRRSNSEAIARRRKFKDAMRQRIRDIAASRDLSDEEIKPALKLKHHDIAEFTEKHVVNLDWLLGGGGQIFKTGKPR